MAIDCEEAGWSVSTPCRVGVGVAIGTDGGNIVFTAAATVDSELDEYHDLTLSAGEGAVSFQANLGDAQPIGKLTVTRADAGIAFGGASSTETGPVSSVRAMGGIDLGAEAAILDGITLDAGDGNTISLITDGNLVRFNGPIVLESDAWIDTSDAGNSDGAEIRFTVNAPVDNRAGENNDLTLTAGYEGTVSFNANLGEVEALGQLIVTDAAAVTFARPRRSDPDSSGEPRARGGRFRSSNATTTPSQQGSVKVGRRITFTRDGSVASSTDAVRFNGPVQLQSDLLVDTSDGGFEFGAEIRFTVNAPVDSQAGENNDLILTGGYEGAVSFNADLGANEALGQLIVTEAAGVAFGSDPDEGDPDLGPVALVRVDGDLEASGADPFAIDVGSVAAIGDAGITLNAGDGNTLSFVTTSDAVRFNGAVQLASDVLVDTSDAGADGGAEIRFTSSAPVDSQPGESNGLTLTAGADGAVSFNADLGAGVALGWLIVTDAAAVAFGNEPSYTDADLGPVTAVWIDGDLDPTEIDPENPQAFALDVGSVTAIGDGGITLNAGDGGTVSFFTTGDAVRFRGAVVLESDALVDTTGAGIETSGADILFDGTVDGTEDFEQSLWLVSHGGTVTVTGAVGADVPLDTLWLQDDLPDSTGAMSFRTVYAPHFDRPAKVEFSAALSPSRSVFNRAGDLGDTDDATSPSTGSFPRLVERRCFRASARRDISWPTRGIAGLANHFRRTIHSGGGGDWVRDDLAAADGPIGSVTWAPRRP